MAPETKSISEIFPQKTFSNPDWEKTIIDKKYVSTSNVVVISGILRAKMLYHDSVECANNSSQENDAEDWQSRDGLQGLAGAVEGDPAVQHHPHDVGQGREQPDQSRPVAKLKILKKINKRALKSPIRRNLFYKNGCQNH